MLMIHFLFLFEVCGVGINLPASIIAALTPGGVTSTKVVLVSGQATSGRISTAAGGKTRRWSTIKVWWLSCLIRIKPLTDT
jgi:hypothetical protein